MIFVATANGKKVQIMLEYIERAATPWVWVIEFERISKEDC